MSKNYLTAIHT